MPKQNQFKKTPLPWKPEQAHLTERKIESLSYPWNRSCRVRICGALPAETSFPLAPENPSNAMTETESATSQNQIGFS